LLFLIPSPGQEVNNKQNSETSNQAGPSESCAGHAVALEKSNGTEHYRQTPNDRAGDAEEFSVEEILDFL